MADKTLTIIGAHSVRAGNARSVANWRADAEQCMASDEIAPYRGMTSILFAELGQELASHVADAVQSAVGGDRQFADAGHTTQAEMACEAVSGLLERLGSERMRDRCGLTIYSTSGVDENFFQSTVSRISSETALSRIPHFSVGQLQGASLVAAVDIIQAMLVDQPEATAMFVGAEKWPLPFPRVMAFPAVLGDGSAALGFSRESGVTGLRVMGTLIDSADPYVGIASRVDPEQMRGRLVDAVSDVCTRLLHQSSTCADELQGCIPSGLDRDFDSAVLNRIAADVVFAVTPAHDVGYLGVAAAPMLVGDLLQRLEEGSVTHGQRFLIWSVSLGGCVAAMLLQAVAAGELQ